MGIGQGGRHLLDHRPGQLQRLGEYQPPGAAGMGGIHDHGNAVQQANAYLRDCGDRWTTRMQPELEAQREHASNGCAAARWSSCR